jgi:4'-phosphopantetheinyl transferase
MSLASALLKRLFVHKTLGIPWASVRYGRKGDDVHGKPCCILPSGARAPIEFNISHQAGLVTLIGSDVGGDVELGTDIVCVNERNDYRVIDTEGFEGWVDMYTEIFSEEESWDMKYTVDSVQLLDGTVLTPAEIGRHDRCCVRNRTLVATLPNGETKTFSSDLLIDAKLRRFYTFWCYKEAFIKQSGEALLAPWLRDLEFKNVRSPAPGTVARCSTHGSWGEKVGDVEVWMHRRRISDVKIEIQAFEENFMIGVAIKPAVKLPSTGFPQFESLNLEKILEVARGA